MTRLFITSPQLVTAFSEHSRNSLDTTTATFQLSINNFCTNRAKHEKNIMKIIFGFLCVLDLNIAFLYWELYYRSERLFILLVSSRSLWRLMLAKITFRLTQLTLFLIEFARAFSLNAPEYPVTTRLQAHKHLICATANSNWHYWLLISQLELTLLADHIATRINDHVRLDRRGMKFMDANRHVDDKPRSRSEFEFKWNLFRVWSFRLELINR